MESVLLDMKKGQMSKLARGDAVQVSPAMVGAGMPMLLKKDKLSKLMKAKTAGKAMRLKLTEEEMVGSGITKKMKRTRAKSGEPILDMSVSPMVRPQRFFAGMVDQVLPAARPLIQLGNAQYGDIMIPSQRR